MSTRAGCPFQVKICGVRSREDARWAARCGADAIGLNFVATSPRSVSVAEAAEIAADLPPRVARVGVFVNATVDQIRRTRDAAGLDLVQLHGDEAPEFVAELQRGLEPGQDRILRAFRCREGGFDDVEQYLRRCRALDCLPAAVLLDAYRPGQYGGTGEVIDWQALGQRAGMLGELPVILAGGLTPDNVAEAIRIARPAAVDTASGVESSPGHKDPQAVECFIAAARRAFDSLT